MSLTTDEAAQLATLRSVRDKLIMGQVPDRVLYAGFETWFKPADLPRIEGRIEELERKEAGKSTTRRGAMRFNL